MNRLLPGIALAILVIVVAVTRHISMGSIVAAGTFPLGVWLILHPPKPVLVAALIGVTVSAYVLATYAVFPSGVIAMPIGPRPTLMGGPGVLVMVLMMVELMMRP